MTRQLIIWTVLLFIGLTLLTMKEQAPVDGHNTYGFPFTFYTYCADCDKGFNLPFFLADIGLTTTFAFLAIKLKNKISTSLKNQKS